MAFEFSPWKAKTKEHIEARDNPHAVTAAQTGAIPQLNPVLRPGDNLNIIRPSGFYRLNGVGIADGVPANNMWGHLINSFQSDFAFQIICNHTSPVMMWIRIGTQLSSPTPNWHPWRRVPMADPVAWITPTFQNGFVSRDANNLQFCIDNSNTVWIVGSAGRNRDNFPQIGNTIIFNLPAGFRPNRNCIVWGNLEQVPNVSNAPLPIMVQSNGDVRTITMHNPVTPLPAGTPIFISGSFPVSS